MQIFKKNLVPTKVSVFDGWRKWYEWEIYNDTTNNLNLKGVYWWQNLQISHFKIKLDLTNTGESHQNLKYKKNLMFPTCQLSLNVQRNLL